MDLRKKIIAILTSTVIILTGGVLGYELIEGWNFLDALYMTVITLGTIGYGETHPLSTAGRIFTIFLILGGMGAVSYGLVTLTTMVADGEIIRILKRTRMDKAISKLKHHYIVCGAGKTGSHIILELAQAGKTMVVVDQDPNHLKKFQSRDSMLAHFGREVDVSTALFIEGDASSDETLIEAGIRVAEGIFCALPTDKDNLFVVLSAKGLNPEIRIVSKCGDEESDRKFVRAGAAAIVSPNRIGGLRMASEMIRPAVVSFLDVMLHDPQGYRFEEIQIGGQSPFAGKTLRETPLATDPSIRVVAATDEGHGFRYNPPEDTLLRPASRLIVLGKSGDVHRLRRAVNPER